MFTNRYKRLVLLILHDFTDDSCFAIGCSWMWVMWTQAL
jgi:hypothetical protein